MSIRGRLGRLEHRIGGADVCRFCGRPHIRTLAQIVAAVYSDGALCDCSMCECHRPLEGRSPRQSEGQHHPRIPALRPAPIAQIRDYSYRCAMTDSAYCRTLWVRKR